MASSIISCFPKCKYNFAWKDQGRVSALCVFAVETNTDISGSYASILKWMSLSNSDLISTMSKWYLPYLGREPYNKKLIDAAIQGTKVILSVFERHLLHHTFLVTEHLTLADIVAACIIGRGYQVVGFTKINLQ